MLPELIQHGWSTASRRLIKPASHAKPWFGVSLSRPDRSRGPWAAYKRRRQHGWRGGWLRAVLMYLIMEVGLPDLALGHAHTTVPAHLALRYTLHHQPERATIA